MNTRGARGRIARVGLGALAIAAMAGACSRPATAPAERVDSARSAITYGLVHTFTSSSAATKVGPRGGGVVSGSTLYGTAGDSTSGRGVVYQVHVDGSGYQELHTWQGPSTLDMTPTPLLLANTGGGARVYGTAPFDGPRGTLFEIVLGGIGTGNNGYGVEHSFTDDGIGSPTGALAIVGSTICGTTTDWDSEGGVYCAPVEGATGDFRVLHSFASDALPTYGLVASGGLLYGVAIDKAFTTGILYRVDPSTGAFSVLHSFAGTFDDPLPSSAPIDVAGTLYGTTRGTLYSVGRDGSAYKTLNSLGHHGVEQLSVLGSTLYGCDGTVGELFQVNLDGTFDNWVRDPRSPPSGAFGCKGAPSIVSGTLFESQSFSPSDDGTLYKLDFASFSVSAKAESRSGSNVTGTIVCTPTEGIPAGGSFTCTLAPADAVASIVDNGAVNLLPRPFSGTYVVGNVRADHVITATFARPNGAACDGSGVCATLACVDGVCCNGGCNGQCEACNLPGQVGTCAQVTGDPPKGRVPCASDGSVCGGKCGPGGANPRFACKYPGNQTACSDPSCTGGTATLAATCDSSGACAPAAKVPCTPFTCGPAACKTDCQVDSDCVAGSYCSASGCKPKSTNGGSCSASTQCGSGHCVDGLCCDVACDGQCEACDSPGQPGTCSAVVGPPRGRAPCASDGSSCGGACDGTNRNACTYPAHDVACRAGSCANGVAVPEAKCDGAGACPAPSQQACAPFVCKGDACGGDCAVNSDCAAGLFCNAGTCVTKRGAGDACAGDGECAQGPCVDGVCCNSTCTGQCEACDVPGHRGVCTPFGGDPLQHDRTECSSDGSTCAGACDGTKRNACTFPAAGTICGTASCVDGVARTAAACSGDGRCAPGQTQVCAPFVCGPTACDGDCKQDTDCASGSFCRAQVCTPKLANGTACTLDSQCGSTHCVDGVCCGTACDGQCAACNVTAHEGTCTALAGNPRGKRAACAGAGACAGTCDGVNPDACALPGTATVCAGSSCSAGTVAAAAHCDGRGACNDAVSTTSCGAYACQGSACATRCAGGSECAAGYVCADHECRPAGQTTGAGPDASAPDGASGGDGGGGSSGESSSSGGCSTAPAGRSGPGGWVFAPFFGAWLLRRSARRGRKRDFPRTSASRAG